MTDKKDAALAFDTYKTFLKVLFFSLVLCFFVSLFAYIKDRINPDFFTSYLTYKTIHTFCAYFTIFVYFFFSVYFTLHYLVFSALNVGIFLMVVITCSAEIRRVHSK